MLLFYVYILKCKDGSYYVGHTDNIEKRLSEHAIGKYSGYTSSRLPLQLVFMQEFGSRYEALCAERKMKKWTRLKKELLIHGGWEAFVPIRLRPRWGLRSGRTGFCFIQE